MAKRLWFVLAACALAAAFLGCQNDVTEPNPVTTECFDANAIEGYVKDAFGFGIEGAEVDWYREGEFGPELIGYDHEIGSNGWYDILWESAWTAYEGDYLFGVATHPDYDDAYCEPIESFDPAEIPYRRDFTMYPN